MRWILVTLVAANISLFLYMQFSASSLSREEEVVVSGDGVDSREPDVSGAFDSLTLLGERQRGSDTGSAPSIDSIRLSKKNKNDQSSLSEVGQAAKASPLSEAENIAIRQPLCALVGKFPKLLPAEFFAEKLVAFGVRAEVKRLVVSSQSGYWLHLPPQPSRKQALRLLAKMWIVM